VTALTVRLNEPPPPPSLLEFETDGYGFVERTGIFHVATHEGRLVALACAIVRDREWFLSGFWTDANMRQRGIGGPLLRRVWDEGLRRGATRQFVWASPDPTAIATYMKLGMVPGSQLFAFSGVPRSAPSAASGAGTGLELAPLTVEAAAAVDREIRGVPRAVDHEWWQRRDGVLARSVTKRGKLAGYYYLLYEGRIGAAAWLATEDGAALLDIAMREAAQRAEEVSIVIPGMNRTALEAALGAGLRLQRNSHLLWTEPIGRMEQYIPSGPLLF
jgi:GNAT superfamily N-acetyltransferase